jgi:hypothetical protein
LRRSGNALGNGEVGNELSDFLNTLYDVETQPILTWAAEAYP